MNTFFQLSVFRRISVKTILRDKVKYRISSRNHFALRSFSNKELIGSYKLIRELNKFLIYVDFG